MSSSLFGGGTKQTNSTIDSNTTNNTQGTSDSTTGSTSGTAQSANQSGVQQGNTAQQNVPWDQQIPYILQGLDAARKTYSDQASQPYYQGPMYAALNPDQQAAIDSINNYANTNGRQIGDVLSQNGLGLVGNLNDAAGTADTVIGSALTDPTQSNIASAGQYANNPYTAGMIQAAITPIQRQLTESAIPGMNASAIGSGNADSSRAGVMEALLRRDAGVDESNVASQILGNQYNNGLQLAHNARTSGFGAATSALNSLSDLGRTGANLMQSGYETNLNNDQIPLQMGGLRQQDAQNAMTAAFQKWQGGLQMPWTTLGNYWNMVGKPLGSTTTGSSMNTNSQNSLANSNTNAMSNTGTNATQNSTGTQQGTTDSTTTGGGPGLLGGLFGLASGVGSLFTPGLSGTSIAGNIGNFFSGAGK